MFKRKSKRIQHRRLHSNEVVRITLLAVFLSFFTFLQAQTFSHKQTSISEAYHKAETFYLLHQWEKAIPIYQKILLKEDSSQAVHYRLACIYEQLGKIQQGLFHIEKALYSQGSNSDYLYQKIKLLEIDKNYEDAWVIHQYLISIEPRKPTRYIAAIQNCKERIAVPDMLDLTNKWLEQFGPSIYIVNIRFECQKFLGLTIQAEDELSKLVKEYPYMQAYQTMLSSLKPTESNNINEILLQIASSNDPSNQLNEWIMGMSDSLYQAFSDSLSYFHIPQKVQSEIYTFTSESAASKGDLEKARTIAWFAVKIDPSRYESWLFLLLLETHFKNSENLEKIKIQIETLFPFYMDVPQEIEAIINHINDTYNEEFWSKIIESRNLPALYLIEPALSYSKKYNILLKHKDSWSEELQNSPSQYHWIIEQIK